MCNESCRLVVLGKGRGCFLDDIPPPTHQFLSSYCPCSHIPLSLASSTSPDHLPPLLHLRHQTLQVHLRLHHSAVRHRRQAPHVTPLRVHTSREQRSQNEQVPTATGKVQRRVSVQACRLHR